MTVKRRSKLDLLNQTVSLMAAMSIVAAPAFAGKGGGSRSSSSSGGSRSSGSYGGGSSRPSSTPSYKPSYTPSRPASTPSYKPSYTPSSTPRSTPSYKPSYTPPAAKPTYNKPTYTPPAAKPTYNKPTYTPPTRTPTGPSSSPATRGGYQNQQKPSKPVGPSGPSAGPTRANGTSPWNNNNGGKQNPNNGSRPSYNNNGGRPQGQPANNGAGYKRTPTKNGGYVEDRGNHQVHYRADGSREKVVSNGKTTIYRKDGSKAQVSHGNTTINYGKNGSQTVMRGGVRQYSQTRVVNNGSTVIQRTYYGRGNTTVIHNYNVRTWGGNPYYVYHPPIVYAPSYYGYLYTPWYTPVTWSWGWHSSPWYSSYGYYYHPYAVYRSPAYWLTDFLLADYLAMQYDDALAARRAREAEIRAANADAAAAEAQIRAAQAEADAAAAQQQAAPISESVKEQIKEQVDQAIKAHQQQQTVEIGSILADTNHIYAVSDDLDVTDASNNACALTSGDLIKLSAPVAEASPVAQMIVVTSKKGSCAAGSQINVAVSDLQNFQNDFTERLEKGLDKMKTDMRK